MRVIVTGGTGFIGSRLCGELLAAGHSPVVLTRNPSAAQRRLGANVEIRAWQPEGAAAWERVLDGADAVINLAGESIASRRWSGPQKAAIRDSRILGTRSLVEAVRRVEHGPRLALLNASATGYYGPRGDELVSELEPPGDDFLARVCRDWEREALAAEQLGVRVALVRTGVVLGKGGALQKLLPPFKMFVGGPLGSGRQGFPWVHLADVVGIYLWALENATVSGPLNAAGPQPMSNREFCEALGRVLKRPCWMPVPGSALKLLLGEMAESLLIQGQKVLPERVQQLGYVFKFRTVETALQDVLS